MFLTAFRLIFDKWQQLRVLQKLKRAVLCPHGRPCSRQALQGPRQKLPLAVQLLVDSPSNTTGLNAYGTCCNLSISKVTSLCLYKLFNIRTTEKFFPTAENRIVLEFKWKLYIFISFLVDFTTQAQRSNSGFSYFRVIRIDGAKTETTAEPLLIVLVSERLCETQEYGGASPIL